MLDLDTIYNRLFVTGKEHLSCVRKPDDVSIAEITWEYDGILYNISECQNDNDSENWMLRINPTKTFDKWSNADIEEYYVTLEDLYFDIFENSLTWLYRRLAHIYIEECAEDLGI